DELFADEETKAAIEVVTREKKSGFDAPVPDAGRQASEVTLQLPSSFSFSQLAAFANCPLQYKFAHLLKIPTLDKGTMTCGKLIHAVLETFITRLKEKPDAPMPLEELLAEYEKGWTGEWYEDAEERERYHRAGREAVASAHARTLKEKPSPWMTE